MAATTRCTQCGALLADQALAMSCPACSMRLGLAHWQTGPSKRDAEAFAADPQETFVPEQGKELPAPDELLRHFPELEILGLLGKGGMGVVYKARQRELDRVVALKIIKPDLAGDPGFAERFTREARLLARLNHPQIVTIHDFGKRDQIFFLIMEYVNGINLRELMREKKLQPGEALAIVPPLCEALQAAHDEGVVHRDIKPENILLDRKGRIKIADFGLAKLVGSRPPDGSLTGTRQVVGTPNYMAPEQMQGSRTVDHRADIYSLGVVIYEMLTGELPVGRFEPPSHRARLDVRLDEVVLRSLERDPERRYQHASDFKSDVEMITLGGSVDVDEAGPSQAATKPAGWAKRHSSWWKFGRGQGKSRKLSRHWKLGLGLTAFALCLLIFTPLRAYLQVRLVKAAEAGDTGTVNFLLAVGVDANACNENEGRDSALLRSALAGHTSIVQRLLDCGASVDAQNIRGSTPLMAASANGHRGVVATLLKHHSDISKRNFETRQTALHTAAFLGHVDIVRLLLDAGAFVDETDKDGVTALMFAARYGHPGVVKLLLDRGADPKAVGNNGLTSLMLAANWNYPAIVNLLLPVSQASAVDASGTAALDYAIANGHQSVVEALLAGGAAQTGTLWLWRGMLLAHSAQYAEALPCFEKAAAKCSVRSGAWKFAMDGWSYEVFTPACFTTIAIGTCQQRVGKTAESSVAFKTALANVPSLQSKFALHRRTRQEPERRLSEQFEISAGDIQNLINSPASAWRVHLREQMQSSRSTQSVTYDNVVRDFFK